MSIYIRPFKASDLGAFVPIEPLDVDEIKDPEFAKAIEDSGLAVTGIRNGQIVGCGGVHPVDDIHGEMWLRLSKTCQQHPLETLRWLKSGLEIIEDIYPFEQLNASIKCCFEKSIRLIEYLGFTKTQEDKKWAVYSKRIRE
ncbi:MAG: GNAT family N-acetyltransferase [Planctomycetota bacterium]|jgi:RimJ/RimL family protein N-acetyltransferase